REHDDQGEDQGGHVRRDRETRWERSHRYGDGEPELEVRRLRDDRAVGAVPRPQRDRRDPRVDRYRRDRPQGIGPRATIGARSSAPRSAYALNANATDGTRSATDSIAIRS